MITDYKVPEFRMSHAPFCLNSALVSNNGTCMNFFRLEFQTGNNISVSSNPQGGTNNINT